MKHILSILLAVLLLTSVCFAEGELVSLWMERADEDFGGWSATEVENWGELDGVAVAAKTVEKLKENMQDEPTASRELFDRMQPTKDRWTPDGLVRCVGDIAVNGVQLTASESFTADGGECVIYRFYVDTDAGIRDVLVLESFSDAFYFCESIVLTPTDLIGSCQDGYVEEDADEPQRMKVTNCKEWVTLRAEPDKKSAALRHVALNDTVAVLGTEGSFTYCMNNGVKGYIRSDLLMPVLW